MAFTTPSSNRKDEQLPGAGATTNRRQGSGSGPGRRKPAKARNARLRGPLRTVIIFVVLLTSLFAGIFVNNAWGDGELTPQLGLDLAGGRQIVIEPLSEETGASISPEQVDQAIDIIRRRVDGSGVAEAEVSRLGQTNIAVAIPGTPSAAQLDSLSRSSQMSFRPVLVAVPVLPDTGQPPAPPREIPLPGQLLEEQVDQMLPPTEPTEDDATEQDATEDDATDENRGGTKIPAASDTTDDAVETDEAPATDPTDDVPAPINPSDLNQITTDIQQEFMETSCADESLPERVALADATLPVVACNTAGTEKYVLGPIELTGSNLVDATAGAEQVSGGFVSGRWQVVLTFDDEGGRTFSDITRRLYGFEQNSAQNRFAMVLDGEVISAPTVNTPIDGGVATITGDFTVEEAQTLANQLKFGALPMSFQVQTNEQISPTLGGEQLRWGLVAGVIGLLLVFVFMLLQYHLLGLVTIGSLILAMLMTYATVTLLGSLNNFRLTMAGITGLIISIGFIADSFIVYFERIRDEVRSGRPLRYAVDTGWDRARRTILISKLVNLIAAGVLYYLSEAGVKAFAFALGLMTIIDLIVVFMFTNPVVSMLANTKFFGEGRKWSGMEPERLGAKRAAYLGAGQFREPDMPPSRRSRHTREELEGGVV